MIYESVILEMLKKEKHEWEKVTIKSIEPGNIIKDGQNLSGTIYYVEFICSNKSEFFPDASKRKYSITITEEDVRKNILEIRDKKLELIGI